MVKSCAYFTEAITSGVKAYPSEKDIFDGDESGKDLKLNIAGICDLTNKAVTKNCFDKYCGQEKHADCPFLNK